jgi:hypothetical protein
VEFVSPTGLVRLLNTPWLPFSIGRLGILTTDARRLRWMFGNNLKFNAWRPFRRGELPKAQWYAFPQAKNEEGRCRSSDLLFPH